MYGLTLVIQHVHVYYTFCSTLTCIHTCTCICTHVHVCFFALGWIIKTAEEKVVVSLLDTSRSVPDIKYSLAIEANFSWKIHIYGQEVSPSMCRLFTDSPATLHTVHAVSAIVQSLEKSHMCRNFTIFSLKKIHPLMFPVQ